MMALKTMLGRGVPLAGVALVSAAALILTSPGSAAASVSAFGFEHEALGNASLSLDNGDLIVSDVGGGGSDGVRSNFPIFPWPPPLGNGPFNPIDEVWTETWSGTWLASVTPDNPVVAPSDAINTAVYDANNQLVATSSFSHLGGDTMQFSADFSMFADAGPLFATFFKDGQEIDRADLSGSSAGLQLVLLDEVGDVIPAISAGGWEVSARFKRKVTKTYEGGVLVSEVVEWDIGVDFGPREAGLMAITGGFPDFDPDLLFDHLVINTGMGDVEFAGFSHIDILGAGNVGGLTIDDMSYVVVPEPTSAMITLICVGGLLSRRRR